MDSSRDPRGFLDRELNILFSNKSAGERMNWEVPSVMAMGTPVVALQTCHA